MKIFIKDIDGVSWTEEVEDFRFSEMIAQIGPDDRLLAFDSPTGGFLLNLDHVIALKILKED